jgi:hypothetical protein
MVSDVYNGARVDKSRRESGTRILRVISPADARATFRTEEKPLAIAHERLSGELLGLTCVLAVTFGKKVSQ